MHETPSLQMPAIKLLFIHNTSDLYGASRSLLRLNSRLNRSQFQSTIILPEKGTLEKPLTETGAKVLIKRNLCIIDRQEVKSLRLASLPLRFLSSTSFISRIIREEKIDLVHTNTGVLPAGAWAARLNKKPHLWHIREWFQEFRQLWPPYANYIIRNSRKVLAVSHAIASQFPQQSNVQVLHNGFDVEEFNVPKDQYRADFRKKHGLQGQLVIGTVGRIKLVRKGQEFLIQAARILKDQGVRAKVVIVGAPFPGNEHHLEQLQKLVKTLKLENDVVFTGEMSDPKEAYPAFDIFVLPSAQPEPFGGVVMEAMCMGIPVIATAIGGSLDQVAPNETGLLVPPANPEKLANALLTLARDDGLRNKMALSGPKRIKTLFSMEKMVQELETLYKTIAKK